jgi:hypothetical protein
MIFSIALNGYDLVFSRLPQTHRYYAERIGCCYHLVNRPKFSTMGRECAWLKIILLLSALRQGLKKVLFIDADVEVRSGSPSIFEHVHPRCDLFMANGFSGRPNSGVILAGQGAEEILLDALRRRKLPVSLEDEVGWGENAQMIAAAKRYPRFGLLQPEWNNNRDPAMRDYFRHYSDGPMRSAYHFDFSERLARRGSTYVLRAGRTLRLPEETLDSLALRVVRRYPVFGTVASMRALLADAAPIEPPRVL